MGKDCFKSLPGPCNHPLAFLFLFFSLSFLSSTPVQPLCLPNSTFNLCKCLWFHCHAWRDSPSTSFGSVEPSLLTGLTEVASLR